ncbi:MAG TPA: DHA2 family efflux MFS transporter permease subunit, partial [Ktedonobacterales bacterium]|nr:DHA2 family efflux MFS transporter permease subunit [Ktedonobacterales bacterium]
MRLDYKWQAALITALGLFMAVLDNTIVSVALPQMADSFHTDISTITWVATAYFLAQAAIIPVTGYLSDRIGTKTVFLSALAIFTIGSGLCAIAPSHTLLIGFRVLQGIGGGALFPTAFAIIFRVFPPAERGPASAIIGVPILLAPAFGPTLGGYLTTTFDWHAIFTINLPIGVIAFTLAAIFLRGRAADNVAMGGEPAASRRFDLLGLVLAMGGFTTLVYGITEAGSQGWDNRTVDIYLAIGAVLLIIFVIVELRSSDPVMDMRLFKNYTFTISNVLMWALGAFLFGSLFLLPYFFELVQGLTPLSAGEILISQGLAAAVSTVIAGSLYNRVGPRIMGFVGFALVTAGTWGFAHMDVATTGQSLQIWLILRGLGLGFINIPLQTLALSVVSNRAMARASSLVNVTRQVASALGVAVLTSYLTQSATAHGNDIAAAFQQRPPTGIAAACLSASGVTVPTPQALQAHMGAIKTCVENHAFTMGLNDTFFFVMLACGICAVLALIVGRDPAVQAAKAAAARGEEVAPREPVFVGE